MSDCLFCRIIDGKIPAKIVHRDVDTVAFEDVNPQGPVHLLVVPRKHVPTLNELGPEDDILAGKLLRVAAALARERGVAESGWRAVLNSNRDAGQSVFHVHVHLLGGRTFAWPPG